MIDYYDAITPDADIDELVVQGQSLQKSGRSRQAIKVLCSALLHSDAREEAYLRAVRALTELHAESGAFREALSLAWYTKDEARQRQLFEHVPAVDRAYSFALWASQENEQRLAYHQRAAGEFEAAGLLVRSAVFHERARDFSAARALWSRLSQALDEPSDEHYAAGLACFNVARTSRLTGDTNSEKRAAVDAVQRLERAADAFEAIGQRERAFDCYHVLIAIGDLTQTFEHVLEGLVNAIRILSEDNLRSHALGLYEHAIDLARDAREYAAAASLARDFAAYAKQEELVALARHARLREAELWHELSKHTLEQRGAPELAENALLASVLARAELGHYRAVGHLYQRLSELELEPERRAHYARAVPRYKDALDSDGEPTTHDPRLDAYLAPPEVWHVDLIEWEERGSAADACADVLIDADLEDHVTRRRALFTRLVALARERAPAAEEERASLVLAKQLAGVGLYSLLSPLEKLYESTNPEVRRAAVAALSKYFYKRTFVTLEAALADPDERVVSEATRTLGRLRFDHAVEPLLRIHRTNVRPLVRDATLQALVFIDVPQAAELLLENLAHGSLAEHAALLQALKSTRGSRFEQAARAVYPHAEPHLRHAIEEVFEARGVRLRAS